MFDDLQNKNLAEIEKKQKELEDIKEENKAL